MLISISVILSFFLENAASKAALAQGGKNNNPHSGML
jgi:hypothetical protein